MWRLFPFSLLLLGCGGHKADPNSMAEIARYPKIQTVSLGEPAEFSVVAVGKGLTYQWWHAGAKIPGATLPTLRLAAVTAEDFGDYSVDVIHGDAARGVLTELRETGFPESVSEAQGLPVDGTVTFGFVAKGDPAPAYQWLKDRGDGLYVPIEGATGTTLTVPVPAGGHGAGYEVFATNRKGSVMDLFLVQTP